MALSVDIEKKLGAFQLRVQLEAENGVLALLGASGCGKSMTLKCIAGVETPDRGRIVLDGVTLFDSDKHICLSPQKRRVGYLFQQYALFPNMTVRQNIAAGVREKGQAQRAVPEIIRAMRLEGTEELRPHQLSGGQQQRVALARILVNGPEILLLDEPFSALDSHLRFQLEQEVRSVIRRFGKTVLLVSHNRDEVFRLSDQIAILNDGRVETVGSREAVFADPGTRNGAVLTGCKNISRLERLDTHRVRAVDWGLELAVGQDPAGRDYIGIRMHDLHPGGGENSVRCQVAEEIENPFSVTVMLRPLQGGGTAVIGWETDKETWRRMRAQELDVCLPRESLILLE
jgi:molybdate transport system ATP-binding protein